jgi:hypothetical protein
LTNLNSNLSPKLEDIFNLSHAWSNLVTSAWLWVRCSSCPRPP